MFVSFFRKRVQSYCFMDLRQFPMDVQNCELSFQSCEYSLENIHFKHWDRKRFSVKRMDGSSYQCSPCRDESRVIFKRVVRSVFSQMSPAFYISSPGYIHFWIYDDITNNGVWDLIGKIIIHIAFSPLLF